ncbi:MAG: hypothetical protein KDA80_11690 [Planctomycetaceae bacterium]|nr:hypothetical protein [Planctomycetaceae bacterium]
MTDTVFSSEENTVFLFFCAHSFLNKGTFATSGGLRMKAYQTSQVEQVSNLLL